MTLSINNFEDLQPIFVTDREQFLAADTHGIVPVFDVRQLFQALQFKSSGKLNLSSLMSCSQNFTQPMMIVNLRLSILFIIFL